jgi:diguanylate cyclase (GGDEF)-like protein
MLQNNTHQHRITRVAGTIMIVVTILVAVTFFMVMQRHTEDVLSKSLELYLQSRIQLTETEIRIGFDNTVNISTRPLLIDQLQLVNAQMNDTAARNKLNTGVQSFLQKGITTVALYGKDGQELVRAGVFTQEPELIVPLNLPGQVQLIWDGQLLLRAVVNIKSEGRVVGKVMTETQLPATMEALHAAVSIDETREQALCAPLGLNMQCFPMALSPRVITLPQRSLQGEPLPMTHALEGKTGVVIAKDYRYQEVVAAYAPVGDLGLGMVVKMDRDQLFRPVWQQLRFLIPLLVGMLAIALVLLHWLFVPLVRRLVHSEEQALLHTAELSKEIVEHKLAEEKILHLNSNLKQMAHYDALTGLPNRTLLADRLNQAMMHCQRHQKSLALVFLDLDGFKAINDTYGHDVGDEFLITISQHMKEALRQDDTLTRLGGDEFVAVLIDLTHVEDCTPVIERLLEAAAIPVAVGDAIMQVSARIGVVTYPQDDSNAEQLMRHADQAMYVAKESGRNRYHFFDTAQIVKF